MTRLGQRRLLPTAGSVQALAVAAVQRQQAPRCWVGKAAGQRNGRADRLAAKHRQHTRCGRPQAFKQQLRGAGVSKASVQPQLDVRQGVKDVVQHADLRGSAGQRVKVSHIQSAGGAMLNQHTRQSRRLAAGAKGGNDGPVVLAVTTLGAHHLALLDVKHGNQKHGEQYAVG
jgi:hypothetical protein